MQTVIKFGNDQDWLDLFNKANGTQNYAEKFRMIRALSKTTNINLLKLYLKSVDLILKFPYLSFNILSLLSKSADQNVVRNEDETTIIADVADNIYGRRLAFDYVDNNWDQLFKKYKNLKNLNFD